MPEVLATGTVQFSSDGMKYYFRNPLDRRRAAILDSYEYTFVSAKSLILRLLARCNRNKKVGR
ncbi:MAG: hypothetical protein C5S48_08340 [Candidatus Methanogaster sp.]|nr:MAG: hypothetical protein C5S48_08340 [ANME-2 cluster archaeon]